MSIIRVKTRWTGWQTRGSRKSRTAGTQAGNHSNVTFPHPEFVIKSGRYAGVKIKHLPVDYLLWGSGQGWGWASDELARRQTGMSATPPERKRHKRKNKKHRAKAKAKAHDPEPAAVKGGYVVGRDYKAMREQWELAGGDASQCPFGEDYTGPHLGWEGDEPVIYCTSNGGMT